jgi:hypothetical protein
MGLDLPVPADVPVSTWLILVAATLVWLVYAASMPFRVQRPMEQFQRLAEDQALRRRIFLPMGALGLVLIAIQLVAPGARETGNPLNVIVFALAGGCVWLSLNAFLPWHPKPAYARLSSVFAPYVGFVFRWIVGPIHVVGAILTLRFLIPLNPFMALQDFPQ